LDRLACFDDPSGFVTTISIDYVAAPSRQRRPVLRRPAHQQPALNSIMDDPVTAAGSLEKLNRLPIQTVYPGHGDPFRLEQLKLESS
jgi:hypothetical protein